MDDAIRIVVEKVAIRSQEVIKRDTITARQPRKHLCPPGHVHLREPPPSYAWVSRG